MFIQYYAGKRSYPHTNLYDMFSLSLIHAHKNGWLFSFNGIIAGEYEI